MSDPIAQILQSTNPFNQLSPNAIAQIIPSCQLQRYRLGQTIIAPQQLPQHLMLVVEGQVRVLAQTSSNTPPTSLEILEAGATIGYTSLLRQISTEIALASVETTILLIPPSSEVLELFRLQTSSSEIFALLSQELGGRQVKSDSPTGTLRDRLDLQDRQKHYVDLKALKKLALELKDKTPLYSQAPRQTSKHQLDPEYIWIISSGGLVSDREIQTTPERVSPSVTSIRSDSSGLRLLGFAQTALNQLNNSDSPTIQDSLPQDKATQKSDRLTEDIPYAETTPHYNFPGAASRNLPQNSKYPFKSGKGAIEEPLACFQMLCQYFNVPFKRDTIRQILERSQKSGIRSKDSEFSPHPTPDPSTSSGHRTPPPQIGLNACAAIAELIGLTPFMTSLPANAIHRLPAPALTVLEGQYTLLYPPDSKKLAIAQPQTHLRRLKLSQAADLWDEPQPVILLYPPSNQVQEKFGISWFIPAIKRHKRVLIEVLIASLLVQLFSLANPLITQLIIDQVINGNQPGTLNTLGILLLILALFEALITTFRTNLFIDTTNRIDYSLGTKIIDHLFRLPLPYFEKRAVGEVSSRINELENIRQFLTGTALTVVLDAIFSVVYIVVMILYSWLLTIIALSTLPLFILLTVIVSPIVRKQLRTKAERNAVTQSFLVEVLGGVSTVKAQNLELTSRNTWQQHYAQYIGSSFKTAMTSTTAGSISNFLNKLSGLLLLWVGAYLVLNKQLTLGQLIAFRIIASYTTSPLLRLVQLWQNFQETALSLERLSDIIDSPQEVPPDNIYNIPMPRIKGAVKYDTVSFRFSRAGNYQLKDISLDVPQGMMVGIVGTSGSGKSTLMKLLARLYEPERGSIYLDDYDVGKVELYSLRSQIGVVLQDPLLFQGTVLQNITKTNPEATTEEVIEAAKIAACHEFIMGLGSGYNSLVGERGSSLSGGQRQRIAIARTILARPRLLILDEATSALDYETEKQVCLNLAESFRGTTMFVITHRLATVRGADIILMMDGGAIVERGSHEELMGLKGRYCSLYQQQKFGGEG
jgi:ATP-binding cassette, subfamily B, bacterial HlyB/CyaB